MAVNRIHIVGAAGSGTTTLGGELSERLGCVQFDTDNYFWVPSYPPFQEARPIPKRQKMLMEDLRGSGRWVLSGSLCGWGDEAIDLFDLVVFIYIPTDMRLRRLKARELRRYGAENLGPGGIMHEESKAFMEWAAGYDSGGMDTRSLMLHESWLEGLPCPVMRLKGEGTVQEWADEVLQGVSR